MSFPSSLTTRVVKGRFVTHPDGVAAKGTVRFVLDNFMQGPADDTFVVPFDRTVRLDGNGEILIVLPATNDPQWTPSFYRVVITIEVIPQTYRTKGVYKVVNLRLHVPYDSTDPIDLADVVNLPAPTPGASYILAASQGVPNGVATLGSDGKLLPGQMPAAQVSEIAWSNVTGKPTTFPHAAIVWGDIGSKPTTFPPSGHTHATSDVSGLVSALDARPLTTEVNNALSGKSNTGHTHVISDVTGLVAALDDRATDAELQGVSDAMTLGLTGFVNPKDHNFAGWTFPVDMIQAATILPTAGLSYVVRLRLMTTTASGIAIHITTAGTALTNAFATLHTDAGVYIAGAVTADQSSLWTSGGLKNMPFASQRTGLTAGAWYKVRFWIGTATTMPTLTRAGNSSSAIINAGLSAPNFRFATADASMTTVALAPTTIGTMTGGGTAWWVAVTP